MAQQTDTTEATPPDHEYPRFRSHYLPRTRNGWFAVVLFLGLFAFTQPPLVFLIANRIEPWVFGVPFLYAYLLVIYCALIAVLFWTQRKEL